ncbi:hypothetical protein [Pseudomonas sp. 7-41]|uniref:hypothetical protein n=1 Tax=Pseudomonas sp. 7-41 TaxID=2898483 RepID=UPI001E47776C|nr:hypothetical protein [Pseudomonas sp. 7-41]UHG99209.1 hypothetical protein LQ249_07010 [Pseudomonas sp. 7-41]
MNDRLRDYAVLRSARYCFKFFTLAFSIASFQWAFADEATNNSSDQTEKRFISSPVDHWQTYSQSAPGGTHKFIENNKSFSIKKLKKPSKDFHTGYAFVSGGNLYFEDRGNSISYKRNWLGIYNTSKIASDNAYKTDSYIFDYDSYAGTISACPLLGDGACPTIDFLKGTYPYVYAKKKDSLLSITNYGEALLFKDGKWCRMSMHDDIYSCASSELPVLSAPRGIQFYSSINYQGRVLLGEWPTGRLYEFDGAELKPSDMTPPKIAELSDKRMGYEAQTMASYCGDLFVGYWPKGEVWRYDHAAGKWEFFNRFFSVEEDEPFIPHSYRPDDDLNPAFFGQRITAMVPFKGSLYVTTSNLRSWTAADTALSKISPAKADEYGAIYKVTKPGCSTSYASNLQ